MNKKRKTFVCFIIIDSCFVIQLLNVDDKMKIQHFIFVKKHLIV